MIPIPPPFSRPNLSQAAISLIIPLLLALLTLYNLLPWAISVVLLTLVILGALIFLGHNPGTLLIIYTIALPVYTFSLVILFRLSGSPLFVQLTQPWKEASALFILLTLGIGAVWRLRRHKSHWLDKLVMFYFVWNLLYLFVPWGAAFTARVYGVRANAFFVVLYLLGRLAPLTRRQQKWVFAILVGIGAVAGLFVIVEVIALPANWPVQVGLMDYMREFFNVSPRGHYGLTWTFETSTGLRRRSAFFANPLELASSTLITGVAALYAMLHYRRCTWGRLLAMGAFGLVVFSLILAISRASLVAFLLQMLVVSVWLRKPRWTVGILITAVFATFCLVFFAGPQLITFIIETITFQNNSSQGHLEAWLQGGAAMLQQPLGLGLGRSGHVGSRFGTQVGGENQYVIIGVELGVVGLILYLTILLATIRYSLKTYRQATGITKALAFVAAAAQVALLIPRFTANIELYIFAMYLSWWLVGFAVQQWVQGETAVFSPPTPFLNEELTIANSY